MAPTKHGMSNTAEYNTWVDMRKRCRRVAHPKYRRWGGRGITVCDRWSNSFTAFLEDMGRKPSPSHSIDRINNNGNYELSNCRWATPKEQRQNQSADSLTSDQRRNVARIAANARWQRWRKAHPNYVSKHRSEPHWIKQLAAVGIRADSWFGKLLRHVSITRKLRWNAYIRACRKIPKGSPVRGVLSWKQINTRRHELIDAAFNSGKEDTLDHDPEFIALQNVPCYDAPVIVSNFITGRLLRRLERLMAKLEPAQRNGGLCA